MLILLYATGMWQAGRAGGCPFASLRHQHSRRATEEAVELARVAELFEETTRELLRSSGETWSEDVVERLAATDISSTALSGFCPLTNITCNSARRYREADGRCNNLQNPGWGSANSCMNRLLPPAYQDGVSSPRVAADGSPLPNARKISYTVHPNVSNPATDITHMVMQLGQFIDHDFALAPLMPDPGEIVDLGNASSNCRSNVKCLRVDLCTDGDAHEWIASYSRKTNTTWIVDRETRNPKRSTRRHFTLTLGTTLLIETIETRLQAPSARVSAASRRGEGCFRTMEQP
ncbi:hypothetical protein HPB52_016231 [Rhipicephalus sanguineus]|uniref:Peroxidase n=1 Tax=Rhipicephalus sanguineus TaxID=34632 RepID=A0A9D4QGX9_RHISA|nr:hypothetical protein HPB52_016231 [Rhipicephalus sanguineus]